MTEQLKLNALGQMLASQFVGWVITFASAVWYISATNTEVNSRLTFIEREILSLDDRLDTSEMFRAELMTDLAAIKTDLLWIRKALERDPR
jgi:septal ring factor EnvC (AmiA/AmiB activator)